MKRRLREMTKLEVIYLIYLPTLHFLYYFILKQHLANPAMVMRKNKIILLIL